MLNTFSHFSLRTICIHLTCLALFLIPAYSAVAQMPGQSSGIAITAQPTVPQPDSEATFALDDYSVGGAGGDIYWYVDGREMMEFRNERSITIPSGALGERTNVEVRTARNGVTLTATHTFVPTAVDIILEASTYTPSFYKGRALPSRESRVRATAIVHDNSTASPAAYTYRWTFGQDVLFGGPVKGRASVDVTMPVFSGSYLKVEVYNQAGALVAESITPVGVVQPMMYVYAYSPLRGLIERTGNMVYAPANAETVLYAEPYHLNTPELSPSNTTFTWKQGSATLPAYTYGLNTLLVNGQAGEEARLSVTALVQQELLHYAQETVTVQFK